MPLERAINENIRLRALNAELLAALANLAEYLDGANTSSPHSMRMNIPSWARIARAAIAKAKGREP